MYNKDCEKKVLHFTVIKSVYLPVGRGPCPIINRGALTIEIFDAAPVTP